MNPLIRAMAIAAAVVATPALALDLSAQEPEQVGEVYYAQSRDAMTDAEVSFVFAHAAEGHLREASLQWLCLPDGLTMVYDWGEFLGGTPRAASPCSSASRAARGARPPGGRWCERTGPRSCPASW